MLLVLIVVFLFLWLNKPSKEQQAAQQRAQAEAQAQQQKEEATPLQLVAPDAEATLASIVKTHGTATDGAYAMSTPAAQLTATGSDSLAHVSGTITVGDKQVDVRKILTGDLTEYTPEQADVMRRTLNQLITTYGKYKSFAPFFYGENEKTVLENDQMRVTFANKGGIIEEVVLKKYMTETTDPPTEVTLFNAQTGNYGFAFVTSDQRIYTDSLYFRPTEVTDTSIVMSLPLAKDVNWSIKYTVVPEYYLVKMEVIQKGVEAVIPSSCTTLGFDWRQKMARNEKGRTFEERNSALTYKIMGEGPSEMNAAKNDTENLNGRIKWVAFKNQFFSSVIIANKHFATADLASAPLEKDVNFVKNMSMKATMPYSPADGCAAAFDFYFGPNDYPLLSSLDDRLAMEDEDDDLDLNRLVPLGWGLFRWINQLIVIPVFSFLSKFISNYGIIILLLTIFIKIILFPFTYKSYMSQAKMRVLQPEIKEINDKYPGQENMSKRQAETMSLYSRAGASPLSGCLPMLLQMPILIAMFAFFPSAIELRGQSFLWAHDLSAPDSILTLPFTIPFYGNHVSLFCLLMTAVNIIYTRINMQSQPGSASMPGMKWMMYLMPVMFLFFFNDYASGLSYYYFLSLLITILQTWIFRKVIDEKKVRQQMLENAKKPKKKSGWMARLEAAQKQQEAMMRERAKQQAKRRR